MTISTRIAAQVDRFEKIESNLSNSQASMHVATEQMTIVLKEQDLLERATVAIQQARPLLSASSIKQCEELANSAIEAVFDLSYTVEYSVMDSKFYLNKGDGNLTDLANAEGGGLISVISFVFQVYLLIKMGKRRFLAYDEAFTQISTKYFYNFFDFLKKLGSDLDIEILLVTHDTRVTQDMVDHDYFFEDGIANQVK